MDEKELVIRSVVPEERAAVAGVYARSLVESLPWLRSEQRHSEADHRAFFQNVVAEECDVWIAERHGQSLGVLAMQGNEVDRLYVDPAHQRQGVGTSLLDHAKALAAAGLRLVTLQRNAPARRGRSGDRCSAWRIG